MSSLTGHVSAQAQLADDTDGLARLLGTALVGLAVGRSQRTGPLPVGGPDASNDAAGFGSLPEQGIGEATALSDLTALVARGSVDPAHPSCAGHLHCAPLSVAVAADTVAAALNQSLDSWDQAPAMLALEESVVRTVASLVGYRTDEAGGVLTTGGTESNLMGLLLARDRAGRADGAGRPVRVVCSDRAHFSVARSARVVGLPVRIVETDSTHCVSVPALRSAVAAIRAAGEAPVIVATAGTTDTGAIDPLPEVAALAAESGAWLHVDAAYGGGALLSHTLRGRLGGIELADSVGVDFHKFGWQPIAAGMFLTRTTTSFDPLSQAVAYLNADDDTSAGFPTRLGLSLRTTRRADCLKLAATFQAYGRTGLGRLVETCRELALHAAERIAASAELELFGKPPLTTVVFRVRGTDSAGLRRRLLESGRAVVGRAEIDGEAWLKLTLLNPNATPLDIDRLLTTIVEFA